MMLVRSYQVYGHMNANLDPLNLHDTYKKISETYENKFKYPEESIKQRTDYQNYGFT